MWIGQSPLIMVVTWNYVYSPFKHAVTSFHLIFSWQAGSTLYVINTTFSHDRPVQPYTSSIPHFLMTGWFNLRRHQYHIFSWQAGSTLDVINTNFLMTGWFNLRRHQYRIFSLQAGSTLDVINTAFSHDRLV